MQILKISSKILEDHVTYGVSSRKIKQHEHSMSTRVKKKCVPLSVTSEIGSPVT